MTRQSTYTGDLLSDLDDDTNHRPPENAVLHAEDLGIARLTTLIILLLGVANLLHLLVNVACRLALVLVDAAELAQIAARLVPPVLGRKELGRLGREDKADEEKAGPDELERDGQAPRDVAGVGGRLPVDNVDKEDAVAGVVASEQAKLQQREKEGGPTQA